MKPGATIMALLLVGSVLVAYGLAQATARPDVVYPLAGGAVALTAGLLKFTGLVIDAVAAMQQSNQEEGE